ncbi:MAG: UDP-N-acetylglucosamine 1-carboxyvinyltransferase [Deltaproteobacteria bacterium]|nr:UDP-N-acetylglucosamine 1-carboxyvinyltransferase [Deltaproteobacteria bacterium]
MDRLLIRGPVKLKGRVSISGAKNAALPCMAASILTDKPIKLTNVPDVADVDSTIELLRYMGAQCNYDRNKNYLLIDSKTLNRYEAPYDIVRKMRASSLVLGPLVARYKRARVSLPGGCAIGVRPIDLHIKALSQMGAEIRNEHGYIVVEAKQLKGIKFFFDIVTVTGTENIMMAAVLANGTTVLENCAKEPEVVCLAKMLKKMGAHIEGEGTDRIVIEGVKHLKGCTYKLISDRIEAGTYAVAAAITKGDVIIENCEVEHFENVLIKLEEAGAIIKRLKNAVRVTMNRRPKPFEIVTMPYPGFPTDMQAQFVALATLAEGSSVVKETIFENRFMHIPELMRMGADIEIKGNTAHIRGVKRLLGASLMATDLRASAALVLAALAAEGESIINRIYHLDRGYAHLDKKMRILGAKIERLK